MTHPLVDQLRFARREFVRGLGAVSGPEAERRFGQINCISWIVGHLAWQEQRYWLQAAQKKLPVPELNELVSSGGPSSLPPVEQMWAAWREVTGAADPWLDELTAEKLLEPLGDRPSSTGTFMQRMIYHYWYHLGEGMAVRQLLEHERLPEFVGDIDGQAPYRAESGAAEREPVLKEEFLRKVREAYAKWDALIATLGDEEWLRPAFGGWSLKDIVAHLVWHEQEMLGLLETRTLAGSEMWLWPLNDRNQAIYEQNRERPLEEVRAEAKEARARLLSLLEGLSQEELNDPGRFKDMPPEWTPADLLADNTYLHYQDHLADLQLRIKEAGD